MNEYFYYHNSYKNSFHSVYSRPQTKMKKYRKRRKCREFRMWCGLTLCFDRRDNNRTSKQSSHYKCTSRGNSNAFIREKHALLMADSNL